MAGLAKRKEKRDYAKIGYYGRPITDLSKDELIEALAELVDMYIEVKKTKKCSRVLGRKKEA